MVRKLIPLAALIIIAVLWYSVAYYAHPMPAKDCSAPYDYPICRRAVTPETAQQPSSGAQLASVVLVAVLAIVLAVMSYHASVTQQVALVTSAAGIAKTVAQPSQPANAEATPAKQAASKPQKQTTALVAMPKRPPSSGVDLSLLKK